jgi:hypothetical protein
MQLYLKQASISFAGEQFVQGRSPRSIDFNRTLKGASAKIRLSQLAGNEPRKISDRPV